MVSCRKHWPSSLAVLALLLLAGSAQAAPPRPPIEVENFRVGFASGTQNNIFKLGTWTPVWMQLRAGDARFSGAVELVVPDDDGTPTSVIQPIDIAPLESRRIVMYARPGTNDPEFEIRLVDSNHPRRPTRVEGSTLAKLDVTFPEDTMLLTLGTPQGVELITDLPGFKPDNTNQNHGLMVARIDATAGLLPGRWQGYDAARAIVVDTNNRAAMAALDNLRGMALVDWVRRGGHLVVSVGQNWQQVRDSVLGPILPGLPNGQERINDLGAIEAFVGGGTKPITRPGDSAVLVTKLENIEARGGKVLSAALGVPLVVRGSHGFGRVTVVALDVDQRPFSSWPDRPRFWIRALDLHRLGDDNGPVRTRAGAGARFYQTGVSDLSSKLRVSLEQFQGVTLIPFGWVAFFIFVYILLIGPGDYLFLKKVLKRMELTWVTFPVIVLTVSLVAYYAAYAIKGNELRVNKVDIVDVLQSPGPDNAVPAGGLVRGSTFFDLFSPQNRDYSLSVVPLPLDGGPPSNVSAGESPKRAAGTEVMMSWFGVPESGFGGMSGGRMSFGNRGYSYGPAGTAETLHDVRVPIWSTKSLTARWTAPGPAAPLVESDIHPMGPDRLEGTVANRSGFKFNDAILAFNRQVYLLGPMAPNATIRVELSPDRQLSGHLKALEKNYVQADPYGNNAAAINRSDLMLSLMFHDAVAGSSTAAQPIASIPLHGLDLTGLLALDRPMLIAKIDAPLSRLVFDDAARRPTVNQTSLLRVILPLKADPDPMRREK